MQNQTGIINRPLPLGTLKLTGPGAAKMEKFFERRIFSDTAKAEVYQEAEEAFRSCVDDISGVIGIWQGEFWGKWVLSACRVATYTGCGRLKSFISEGVRHLLALQWNNGYLGTYRDPLNVLPPDPEEAQKLVGWWCNWNWNIWCRKYTLWALIEAWELLQEPEILDGARRLALHLIHSLKEKNIRLRDTGTFAGMPSGSILKPMVRLFEITGEREFFDFAESIIDNWRTDELPGLLSNPFTDLPVHLWGRGIEAKWYAKVYEMQSCYDGILAFYKLTGEEKLLEATKRFAAKLKEHELNAMFSVGYNDIFGHAKAQLNAISEPCDAIHWMRLLHELFLLTDDKSYLDDFELVFYNAFEGGVFADGNWGGRGVRSHGHHNVARVQAGFTRNHCCVNNMPRGYMNMVQTALTPFDGGLSLNLYNDFEASTEVDGKPVKLTVSGDFPKSMAVKVAIAGNVPGKTLRCRVPGWATSVTLDGKPVTAGNWLTLPLTEGCFELVFGRKAEIRTHQSSADAPVEWNLQRWKEEFMPPFLEGTWHSLVFGPILLARSKRIGNTEEEMFSAEALTGAISADVEPAESADARMVFNVTLSGAGKKFSARFCNYSDAADAIIDDPKYFSIFF